MSEAGKRLLGRIRVNGAQSALMPGVQRLQEIERFGTSHLANQNPVRSMSQRGSQEVSDGDGRERCLLPEWCLRAAGFKPHEIRLVDDDLLVGAVGAHLVRLVDNDQVPLRSQQAVLGIVHTGDPRNRGDDLVVLLPRVLPVLRA